MDGKEREAVALKNAFTAIVISGGLAVLKLIAGAVGGSAAMIADALHSCADALSTTALAVGEKSEERKRTGLSRTQVGVSLGGGAVIVIAAVLTAVRCLGALRGGEFTKFSVPALIAVIAAAVSILVKEIMYRITKRDAETIESDALLTDAWCHRADALSSVAALIGIVIARHGAPFMDTAACLFVSLFLLREGVDMVEEAVDLIRTRPVDPELAERIKKSAETTESAAVISIDCERRGGELFVFVNLSADPALPLGEAQRLARELDLRLEREFTEITDCIVHITAEESEDDGST